MPAPIDVSQRQGTSARLLRAKAFIHYVARQVILADAASLAQTVLVIGRTGEHDRLLEGSLPHDDSGQIPCQRRIERHARHLIEPALTVVAIHGQSPAPATADDQIVPSVAIHVSPGHARSQLAEFARQQRLALKIIIRFLVVHVVNQAAHVLEHGLLVVGCWLFDVGCSMFDVGFDLRPRFVNLINPIGLHPIDNAPFPTPPLYLDPHLVGQVPRRKYPHGIVTRQISSAADHLLALHRGGASIKPYLRANPACVGRLPFQPHRHPRRRALVSINSRRRVQVVDDHVQIAVVVQIGERHSLRNTHRIETPLPPRLSESQVVQVAKGQLFCVQAGEPAQIPEAVFAAFPLPHLGKLAQRIGVLHVVMMPGRHQQILIAVQVNIQKQRAPGPVALRHAAQLGNLGKSAVPTRMASAGSVMPSATRVSQISSIASSATDWSSTPGVFVQRIPAAVAFCLSMPS